MITFANPLAPLEEEKKVLAPLLGKLYISAASSEDKLRDLYQEVSIAVDDKLISDATGRNALFKIHVSLGKIVNGLGERESRKSSSLAPDEHSRQDEDDAEDKGDLGSEKTASPAPEIAVKKEELEDGEERSSEGETIVVDASRRTTPHDSLVDSLLSDDDE